MNNPLTKIQKTEEAEDKILQVKPVNPFKVLYLKDHEDVLRTPSVDIDPESILTNEMQTFFDQLFDAMMAEKLPKPWMHAGVSAVQVGVHQNIFWAYNGNTDTYDLFINPVVKLMGESTDVKEESCLSIPEKVARVRRHKRVKVKYYDRDGERILAKFSGWNARVIQHEYDHLQGVLFIDKLED